MASIVEKKFEWFEQHLRSNLKEYTLASPLYQGIPNGEDDMFLVFYLKILLDKLDTMKANSMPVVPDSDRAEPRLGYRTAVPVPKGGLSSIKVGVVPDLNLEEIIESTLTKAIQDYLGSVANSGNLTRELNQNTNLENITRTELKALDIPMIKSNSSVNKLFHIKDYLKRGHMKFITEKIRSNINRLHNYCINNSLKRLFPGEQDDSDVVYVNPPDWIFPRLGIIPLGVYPDLPDDMPELLQMFREGNAAQYTIKEFAIEPGRRYLEIIRELKDKFYNIFSDESHIRNDKVTEAIEIINTLADQESILGKVYKHSMLYGSPSNNPFTGFNGDETTNYGGRLYRFQEEIKRYYLGGKYPDDTEYESIYHLLFEKTFNLFDGTLRSVSNRFIDNLIYDASGEIVNIREIVDGEGNVIHDERDDRFTEYQAVKRTVNSLQPFIVDVSETVAGTKPDYNGRYSEDLNVFFSCNNEWYNSYASLQGYNSILSKADVTSANLKAYRELIENFFNLTKQCLDKTLKDFLEPVDWFTSYPEYLDITVDTKLIEERQESILGNFYGVYRIKEYKGTIICYLLPEYPVR
jgi:hypothetical protein